MNDIIVRDACLLLDFLAERTGVSRRCAKTWLDERVVFVNGRRVWMARHALRRGDRVGIAQTSTPSGRATLEARVLFRDDTIMAIDKPPGHAVTGANGIEAHLRRRADCAGVRAVHRLDRDTSGCLLFAGRPDAFAPLTDLFRKREVLKTYDVLAVGRFESARATLRMPVGGLSAVTRLRRLRACAAATHLEVRIETGRTHQIRRHLAAIGHPVIGDKQYGTDMAQSCLQQRVRRQMLHARRLEFTHPINGRGVEIEAPLPDDFLAALAQWHLRA